MQWLDRVSPLPPHQQSQELRVGKFATGTVPHDDEIHRRNNIEPLIARTDTRDEVGRSITAKHRARPVLLLPFRNEHRLDVELAAAGRQMVVPPSERIRRVRRRTTPALVERTRT